MFALNAADNASLKQANSHVFVQSLANFLQWMRTAFPKCEQTSAAALKVQTLVLGDAKREDKTITVFAEALNKDVTEQVPYGIAVKSLTGRHVDLYTVAAYKDAKVLLDPYNLPPLLRDVNPLDKYNEADKATQATMWTHVLSLIELTRRHADEPKRVIPTKEQLQHNIAERSAAQSPPASSDASIGTISANGTRMLLEGLASAIGSNDGIIAASLSKIDDEKFVQGFVADYMKSIDQNAPTTSLGVAPVSFAIATANQDVEAALSLPFQLFLDVGLTDRYKQAADKAPFEKLVKIMDHCNSLFSVSNCMPDSLMRNIESKAAQLKHQIDAGQPLNPMMLNTIGRDVMQNCNEADLAQCMSNMNQLLPQITKMAGSINMNNLGSA